MHHQYIPSQMRISVFVILALYFSSLCHGATLTTPSIPVLPIQFPLANPGYNIPDDQIIGIACWGQTSLWGSPSTPARLTNIVQLSLGSFHNLALRKDGSVEAWGDNSYGQINVPTGLSEVVQVTAGAFHSAALKSDGSVVVWGDNSSGQTNIPGGAKYHVTSISAGLMHSIFLPTNGIPLAWGLNQDYQSEYYSGISNIVQIAAGYGHTLALRNDGKVFAWGETLAVAIPGGTNVVKGVSSTGMYFVKRGLSDIVQISAGGGHSLALKNDGTVIAWGHNAYGQTNVPSGLTNVVQVAAGNDHSVALKRDGSIVAWGGNSFGQSGWKYPNKDFFTPSNQPTNIFCIIAGPGITAALYLKSHQTIAAFPDIPDHTYGDPTFAIQPPIASSGLPVSVGVRFGSAEIQSNNITLLAAGTITLAANQSGNINFMAAPEVTTSFIVNRAAQSITPFGLISDQFYGVPFSISPPTSSASLPVSVSVKSGPASISGSTITATGTGTVTLVANQSGNENFLAAPEVTTSFVVNRATQALAPFTPIAVQSYGVPFTITPPTSSASLPVSVSVKSGPASISGSTITATGTGTVTLVANQSGNENFLAAPEVTTSFVVNRATQALAPFTPIAVQSYGVPFTITPPISSASLPVSLYVKSGPALISGSTITATGTGTVTLSANQSGNENFLAAPEVTTSFVVNRATQALAPFTPIAVQSYGVPFTITPPISSASLPVSLYVKSGPALISGSTITATGTGTVTLSANQSGNENFLAAPEVTTSFVVNRAPQSIAPVSVSSPSFGDVPFAIIPPKATSGLPVYISVKSGPVKISKGKVVILSAGLVTLAANQNGNTNFLPAPEVTTNFTVLKAPQKITPFKAIKGKTYGVAPFRIELPTSSSKLPVVTTIKSGPATISSGTVTVTGAGTITVAANQNGNTNFLPAPEVTTNFTVLKAPQKITPFKAIKGKTYGVAPFRIELPTSSSKLPVVTTIKSGPATISSGTVTVTGAGTITVAANQGGDANFLPAQEVTSSFIVK